MEIEFGFWIWEQNWERKEREEATKNSYMEEGRAENSSRKGEEVGREESASGVVERGGGGGEEANDGVNGVFHTRLDIDV